MYEYQPLYKHEDPPGCSAHKLRHIYMYVCTMKQSLFLTSCPFLCLSSFSPSVLESWSFWAYENDRHRSWRFRKGKTEGSASRTYGYRVCVCVWQLTWSIYLANPLAKAFLDPKALAHSTYVYIYLARILWRLRANRFARSSKGDMKGRPPEIHCSNILLMEK